MENALAARMISHKSELQIPSVYSALLIRRFLHG